jgi:hypothetical protein
MRRLGLLVGIALVSVAASGSGLAVAGSPSNSTASIASAASVTRAFAAKGIPLEQQAPLMAAHGTNGLPKVLWNRKTAFSQGVISVMVLRTASEAKKLPVRVPVAFDCAGFPASYLTIKSRNVVATYTRCFNLSPAMHLAANPALPSMMAAMQSFGH